MTECTFCLPLLTLGGGYMYVTSVCHILKVRRRVDNDDCPSDVNRSRITRQLTSLYEYLDICARLLQYVQVNNMPELRLL